MTDKELNRKIRELERELPDKYIFFAKEYIKDLNGKEAAIRTGFYSKKGAHVQASRMLSDVNLAAYIDLLKIKRAKKIDISAEKILQEIAKMAFADPNDLMEYDEDGILRIKPLSEMENPEVIASFEVEELGPAENPYGRLKKIKTYDKARALDMLAKHAALYTTNVDITSGGKPIEAVPNVVQVLINHRGKGEELADVEVDEGDDDGADLM